MTPAVGVPGIVTVNPVLVLLVTKGGLPPKAVLGVINTL